MFVSRLVAGRGQEDDEEAVGLRKSKRKFGRARAAFVDFEGQ